MSDYQSITVLEARELIASQSLTILDLRDHRSYKVGHIEGAMLLHDGLLQRLIKQGELDKPVLIYCYRGNKSKEKAEMFCQLGFQRVYSLEGGYTDWCKAAS
jgi:rhodanese-related sulfurtransferase